VGPGNFAAILLLDRPQQAARLVEIRVVRPAVERREALLTGAGAAATVGDAVGPGAMPRHADEQSAIVTEVGGPPLLRVRHQGREVLDHGVKVEALEFLGIVERFAHRIGGGRVAMEHADIEMLWPPVAVPGSVAAGERALAGAFISLCVHVSSPIAFCNFLRAVPCGTMMISPSCRRRDSRCRRCRLRSFNWGGQPRLSFLPADGAGSAFDKAGIRSRTDRERAGASLERGCLASNPQPPPWKKSNIRSSRIVFGFRSVYLIGMITLRQLQYLSALAKHGHFGRAAEACAVTQPAMSMQIRDLERTLGVAVVERRPGEVILTDVGSEIVRRGEDVLAASRDLVDFAR